MGDSECNCGFCGQCNASIIRLSVQNELDHSRTENADLVEALRMALGQVHESCRGADYGGGHWPECYVHRWRALLTKHDARVGR